MSKAMSLKAKIRNIAKQKNIPAQVILQNYMFERLLVRLSASAYKEKFVLKGGMLVAAIVGLDNRATMDLDITLKNLPLTPEAIRSALEQICAVPIEDDVAFEIVVLLAFPLAGRAVYLIVYGSFRILDKTVLCALIAEQYGLCGILINRVAKVAAFRAIHTDLFIGHRCVVGVL